MAKNQDPKVEEANDVIAREEAAPPPKPEEGKPRRETPKNLVEELYTGVAERTFNTSPYWAESQIRPYNPDDLVRKAGDYSIYEDMENDDQVSVCLQIKRDLVIGSGWHIAVEESGTEFEAIQRDLQIALGEDPDVPLTDIIESILDAYSKGFSLSEKIFKYREDGTLTLRTVKTRHPSTWEIQTDDQGNVEKYLQHGPQGDLPIEPKSLIHYVNNRRYSNPYGKSDLRAAYNAWFTKRQIMKWYAMFLQNAAGAKPVARYATGAPQTAINEIFRAIKTFQASTAITIPKEIELEFLEAKSDGEAYAKAMALLNMYIGRALMIPDLLGFQGAETGGGSYALGKDQIRMLFRHIMRRRMTIERIVNKELVWPIVVYNHGFIERYPKFKLNPIEDDVVMELAKLWLECVKGKTYKPSDEEINHFRGIVQFPQGEVEREAPPAMGQLDEDGNPIPPKPGEPQPEQEDEGGGTKSEGKDPNSGQGQKPGEKTEKDPQPSPKDEKGGGNFALRVYKSIPGEYDKKVDYEAVAGSMDRAKQRILDESLPVVKRIFENLYEQMRQKKVLQTQDAEKLEELRPKYIHELRPILKATFRDGFREGRAMGQREILKGNFRTPLTDDKFLEILEAETFQYIGDWSYKVTQKARIQILAAIRDGKPISAVIDLLDEEGMVDAMSSLERFARTKFTEVMNRGRLAAFNDSGVVAAYQYSAILDDRTSEICSGLHGKIFKSGTEPIPPMHFNCRSLLVPITKYESFEVDDEVAGEPIDQFIEENKGDGFSKK